MHIRSWRDFINGRGMRSALRGGSRYLFGRRGQRRVYGLRVFFRLRINVLIRTGEPIATLTRQSDVRLWVDGDQSFVRLEKLIRHARHHIVIQMFIWKNDEIGRHLVRLLCDAANRGVNIDLTKEAVGDFFEFYGDFLTTKTSTDEPWKTFWNHPRIRINYVTNNDHTKVFIIDGHTLLLTGMNIANEYRNRWHDYMVELRGTSYVEQFLTRVAAPDTGQRVRLVMNTEDKKEIRPVLMKLLQNAQEKVVIEHCYLSDPEVIQALIDLTMRGVRITILTPKTIDFHHHANLIAIGTLLSQAKASNISILIYPEMFHAKAMLIDNETAFMGSLNLFKQSIDEMGEVNVLIHKKTRVLRTLRESLRSHILESRSISTPPSLSWVTRWLAWIGL